MINPNHTLILEEKPKVFPLFIYNDYTMLKKSGIIAMLFASFLFFHCSEKKDGTEISPELEEANVFHQKSLDIREELIDVEKALREAEIDYTEAKDLLKVWDKDIIEVPGFEHSHEEGEYKRRYHVHNRMKPFSHVEHLEYQKVMYDEILEIQKMMLVLLAPKVMETEEEII